MIELVLNEKSLDGQFPTIEEFSEKGVLGLIAVLQDQQLFSVPSVLYKSETLTEAKVTPTQTYTDVVFGEESRIHEGIRRYKVQLMSLFDNPFWNSKSKQNAKDQYKTLDGKSLNGSSIAEADARNGILVSFNHPDYSVPEIKIEKNNEKVGVSNVWQGGQLMDATYKKAFIKFKEYAELKFEGQKLDFSKATIGKVWDNITPELEELVYAAFDSFCNKTWIEIPQDKGLGYKPYNKSRQNEHYFDSDHWKKGIHEFRVSGKCRCFGYAEGDKFYLLLIDPNHELGDK